MRNAPASSAKNAAGHPRNGPWFWRKASKNNPEIFSAKNKALIRSGRAPKVDETWIKHNPTHQRFKDQKIVHHHIEQGPIAAGIPERVHQAWHKILHPN